MESIVAIGDIHGMESWRDIVEKHYDSKIVFMGDYLDPYGYVTRENQLMNLCSIISLKMNRLEDVVLLLGNHDLHYFCEDAAIGSRYDFQIKEEASNLFLDNLDLFQYAWQIDDVVFTHAGISDEWFRYDFRGDTSKSIADQLNNAFADQQGALFRVGMARGGERGRVGGIFWADSSELDNPLHGFTQVVGHNRVTDVTECFGVQGSRIIFCDCLRYGKYLHLEKRDGVWTSI